MLDNLQLFFFRCRSTGAAEVQQIGPLHIHCFAYLTPYGGPRLVRRATIDFLPVVLKPSHAWTGTMALMSEKNSLKGRAKDGGGSTKGQDTCTGQH